MKKVTRLITLLVFIISLININILSPAETAPVSENIKDLFSLKDNVYLEVDMPIPDDFPDDLFQYKLSQIYYSKQTVDSLIEEYFVKKSSGEHWEMRLKQNSQGAPSLYYKEDNAAHGALYPSYQGMAFPLGNNDPKLVQADKTLKGFLDELAVKRYEYPFYAVIYEYQYQMSPRSMVHTQEEYLSAFFPEGRKSIEETYIKQGVLGRPGIVIAVRFAIDGIPFALQNTYDPDQDGVTGDGNAVPYAMFTLSNDGKIAHVWLARPFEIEKEQRLQRKIIGWRDIVGSANFAYAIANQQQYGEKITLLGIEPVFGVNKSGVTYPAWRFILECEKTENMDERIAEDGPAAYVFDLYFDAVNGTNI